MTTYPTTKITPEKNQAVTSTFTKYAVCIEINWTTSNRVMSFFCMCGTRKSQEMRHALTCVARSSKNSKWEQAYNKLKSKLLILKIFHKQKYHNLHLPILLWKAMKVQYTQILTCKQHITCCLWVEYVLCMKNQCAIDA